MVKEHSHLGIERGRTRIEIKRADEAAAAVSDNAFVWRPVPLDPKSEISDARP
jgi:hypothetical protein